MDEHPLIVGGKMVSVKEVPYFGKPACFEFSVNDKFFGYVLISVLAGQCFVWHIYVSPKLRRKGYGRSIMNYLMGKSDAFKGFDIVKTEFDASTNNGVRLFRKLGFKRDGNWLVWSASEIACSTPRDA